MIYHNIISNKVVSRCLSIYAHLKGPLKPTPGSQVLGTAGVPLAITRWTRHPHGESMDAQKIVSLICVDLYNYPMDFNVVFLIGRVIQDKGLYDHSTRAKPGQVASF
jgi:hypothetical protein